MKRSLRSWISAAIIVIAGTQVIGCTARWSPQTGLDVCANYAGDFHVIGPFANLLLINHSTTSFFTVEVNHIPPGTDVRVNMGRVTLSAKDNYDTPCVVVGLTQGETYEVLVFRSNLNGDHDGRPHASWTGRMPAGAPAEVGDYGERYNRVIRLQ
jgi:hypothetical protein